MTRPDLGQLLKRREILAHHQRIARAIYGYGVDLRRASWLQSSSVAEPLLRAVDRRWTALATALEERLEPASTSVPSAVLEELARSVQQLRTPLPTVRLLRAPESGRWPIATPLSTTRNGVCWLVLDLPRLLELAEPVRRFVLAAALAHLQCDHGPLFAAHLLASLRKGTPGFLGRVLRPWTSVAYFSADRAGLLVTRDLEVAFEALDAGQRREADWVPQPPDLATRRRALEDFDRSDIMTRMRLFMETDPALWEAAAELGRRNPALARVNSMIGAAVRLADTLDGGALPNDDEAKPAESEAEEAAPVAEPPPLDPQVVARFEAALRDAWSLARCDQRLTKRLGLL